MDLLFYMIVCHNLDIITNKYAFYIVIIKCNKIKFLRFDIFLLNYLIISQFYFNAIELNCLVIKKNIFTTNVIKLYNKYCRSSILYLTDKNIIIIK